MKKNCGFKTGFILLGLYILLLILGTFIGSSIYMLWNLCTFMVSGEGLTGISFVLFCRGLLISFPIVVALESMMLTLFLIRHPDKPAFSIIMYLILNLCGWLLLVPLQNKVFLKFQEKYSSNFVSMNISAGYFRKSGNEVLFFSKVDNGFGDGASINLESNSNNVSIFKNQPLPGSNSIFRDSLIEKAIPTPVVFNKVLWINNVLLNAARFALNNGYSYWLCFASIGLALLSVIGIRNCSKWRLLNTNLVVLFTVIILAFNAVFYGTKLFANVSPVVNGWFAWIPGTENWFIVTVNGIFGVSMLVAGLIIDICKTKKEKARDYEMEDVDL